MLTAPRHYPAEPQTRPNIEFSPAYRLFSLFPIPISGGLLQLRMRLPSRVFEGEEALGHAKQQQHSVTAWARNE